MMKTKTILSGIVTLAFLVSANAEVRTWTDSTGQHEIEAEFVSLEDGEVTLKSTDGRMIKLPLEKLSALDQAIAKTTPAGGFPPAAPATPTVPSTPTDPADPTTPTVPVVPGGGSGGAADVVKQLSGSLTSGNLNDAFALLPPSYEKDLNGLVSEFGYAMDPVLWDSFLTLGKDIGYILTMKKDIVTKSKFFGMMDATGEMGSNYDQMATSFSSFFNNRAITLEELKKGDIRSLIAGLSTGMAKSISAVPNPEVAAALAKLKGVSVETVSETEDTAVLRITVPGEAGPEEVALTKVEGKWVPSEMASQWSDFIAGAREGIGTLKTPEFQQSKTQMLTGIGAINGVVSQLKAAETVEQFDATIESMMGMFGGGDAGATPPGVGPGFPGGAPGFPGGAPDVPGGAPGFPGGAPAVPDGVTVPPGARLPGGAGGF